MSQARKEIKDAWVKRHNRFRRRIKSDERFLLVSEDGSGSCFYALPATVGDRTWVNIVPDLYRGPLGPIPALNGWVLVLEAKNIPHVVHLDGLLPRIHVPALLSKVAVGEIQAVAQERPQPALKPKIHDNLPGVFFFLLLLAAWHGLRMGWAGFSLPGFPPAFQWADDFGLNGYRVLHMGEWWRCATSLTIHSGGGHLLSNVAFGLLFLLPLCRRAGLGLGLFITVASGVIGNFLNTFTQVPGSISIGFSTSLFGCVGALCALAVIDVLRQGGGHGGGLRDFRRIFLTLGAGLALLGMLGGGHKENVDYLAHLWGFGAGIAVGFIFFPLHILAYHLGARHGRAMQGFFLFLAAALMVIPWMAALAR